MHAAILSDDDTWDDAPALAVAAVKDEDAIPVRMRVGVRLRDGSRLRVDLSADYGGAPFEEVRCVGDVVFVGLGAFLFIVDPRRRSAESLRLDAYFGHMESPHDLDAPESSFGLLVTSASEVLCFSPSCELRWRACGLGVDGIVVHRLVDGVLHGDAEHDPPGGWEPFTLDFATGHRLSG